MPTVHIEPNQLRELSRFFEVNARQIQDLYMRLRQAEMLLEMAWQGNSAAEFMTDLERLQQQLRVLVQDLFILAQRIHREADRWEESDQIWVQEYREIFFKKSIFGG
jgi:WXG100 family type VII secretion target